MNHLEIKYQSKDVTEYLFLDQWDQDSLFDLNNYLLFY